MIPAGLGRLADTGGPPPGPGNSRGSTGVWARARRRRRSAPLVGQVEEPLRRDMVDADCVDPERLQPRSRRRRAPRRERLASRWGRTGRRSRPGTQTLVRRGRKLPVDEGATIDDVRHRAIQRSRDNVRVLPGSDAHAFDSSPEGTGKPPCPEGSATVHPCIRNAITISISSS